MWINLWWNMYETNCFWQAVTAQKTPNGSTRAWVGKNPFLKEEYILRFRKTRDPSLILKYKCARSLRGGP